MKRNSTRILTNKIILGFICWLMMLTAQAAGPIWTIKPASGNNPIKIVPENSTATMQYLVLNESRASKRLVIKPMRGIVQTTPCVLLPKGSPGSSCILALSITGSDLPIEGIHEGPSLCLSNQDGSPNLNQCYQPTMSSHKLNITKGATAVAMLTVSPSNLIFVENSTGNVTVTNNTDSLITAINVAATIPNGSNISVQNTTCGASLAIGSSCIITFASSAFEGPTAISIAGTNTNTVNIGITVTSQTQISISDPVQQDRVVKIADGSLDLKIENIGSAIANGITVSNKTNCSDLIIDSSDCVGGVTPGGFCILRLSSFTPYVPCTITISGSNTINNPTTIIAFSYLNGLVFEANSDGSGKIVMEPEFTSKWTNINTNITGAMSYEDGNSNTNAIVTDPGCLNDTSQCAAYQCRAFDANWYLPAIYEMLAIYDTLCANNPCNFGGFSPVKYSNSAQDSSSTISYVDFLDGSLSGPNFKTFPLSVRCARAF